MINGGFITLDFTEQALSATLPTSGEASTIDLTEMNVLRSQWNALTKTKAVFIHNLWMNNAYTSGYGVLSVMNNVPTVYFACALGTFEISVAGNTMTIALA